MAVQKYVIACEYARGVESLRVLSARAGRHVPIGPDCEREYGAGSGPCLIFEIVPPWTMPPPAPPRDIRYRFVYDDVGHLRLYQINGTEYCCADGTPGGSCVTSSPTPALMEHLLGSPGRSLTTHILIAKLRPATGQRASGTLAVRT